MARPRSRPAALPMPWWLQSSVPDQSGHEWSLAREALAETDPLAKCRRVDLLWEAIECGDWHPASPDFSAELVCGRPDTPELVVPGKLKKRGLGSVEGR